MRDPASALRTQVGRNVAHWAMAASRLENLETAASPEAWRGLERYLGLTLRRDLAQATGRLRKEASTLKALFDVARTVEDLERVRSRVVSFRDRYSQVETLVDFYGDAVNSRTNPELAALLRACDAMAVDSMKRVLDPLGKASPPVLTYLDKGLGASILKAGLRLWDGSPSSVAAVKIVFHNLFRPTALVHETGHQVAHVVGWNGELRETLRRMPGAPRDLADLWGSWASEIAADAFAFAHTGYASVASLSDVLAGDEAFVFNIPPGDPHPNAYLRVLLGVQTCRRFFGRGPWDELAEIWERSYPLSRARPAAAGIIRRSLPLLPAVVDASLRAPMRAFGGRPLAALVDPSRVAPEVLAQLELKAGPALYTSHHWISAEALRLLALSGLRAATQPERAAEVLKQQEQWMSRLGMLTRAA